MIKKILLSSVLAVFLLIPVGSASNTSDFDYRNLLDDFSEGVMEQSETDDSDGIELTTFQDDLDDDGVSGILGAVDTFLSFFKLLVAPVAVLFMIIMGVRMVAAGDENEEVLTKSKTYMTYALMGLIIIFMADTIVSVFFGAEGEVFRGGEEGVIEFGRRSATLFEGIYSLVQVVISSVAVFFLVTAGLRYVAGSFSDDQISKAKSQITWSLVGLFVVGVSEFIAKRILFVDQGTSFGVTSAKELFAQVTNFVAGTLGTLSFAALLYAGMLYISGSQNEDNVAKAKKIIMGAFLGLLLAGAAFAITNTVVELDASR